MVTVSDEPHNDKTVSIGISVRKKQLAWADYRAKELKLGTRGRGRSKYFQMLAELDQRRVFAKFYHESDGDVHFFPEGADAETTYPEPPEGLDRIAAEDVPPPPPMSRADAAQAAAEGRAIGWPPPATLAAHKSAPTPPPDSPPARE